MSSQKTETVHSELGASSYKQWKECPASVNFCRDIPKTTSVYAEEGTKAHDLAAQVLLGKKNVVVEDDEMADAIQVYLDHISELRAQSPTFEAVEQKVDLSKYHPKLFGTADYVCYFSSTKTLHVVDYKHGAGVAVEVENSEQLMYYGLGALHMNKFPISEIVLTIVQPRCYHEQGPVRSWKTDSIAMLEYVAQLVDDAKRTEDPNAPFKTGDHCRWCRGQATCPLKYSESIEVAKNVFTPTVSYDSAKLADTLRKLDQVEAWCKAVRSFAYNEAEAGRIPPGFKLVDKRATRKWKNEDHITFLNLKEISKKINSENVFETKLMSPAKVEKLLNKSEKILFEELTVKESSGKNLVEDTDNRPAIAPKIENVFDILN